MGGDLGLKKGPGSSRFTLKRLNHRSLSSFRRRSPRSRKKPRSLLSYFSHKRNLMVTFLAIVSFSIVSLSVVISHNALDIDSKAETNIHKIVSAPIPNESRPDQAKDNAKDTTNKVDNKPPDTLVQEEVNPSDQSRALSSKSDNKNSKARTLKLDDNGKTQSVAKNQPPGDNDENNKEEEETDDDEVTKEGAEEEFSGTSDPGSQKDETNHAPLLGTPEEREKYRQMLINRGLEPDDDGEDPALRQRRHEERHEREIKQERKQSKESKGGNREKQPEPIKLPDEWFKIPVDGHQNLQSKDSFPADFAMTSSIVDVLGDSFNISSLRSGNLTNELQYLGVLLDAGRHYFPVFWIKRMIRVLSVLNFNYLHFRLTDDQTFNVKLESQPLLAFPTTLNNNKKVYTTQELRDIVKYAKHMGVNVIPEINIPGHAAAWGGDPELIIQCPNFICKKGYGVPLNVSHPKLRPILKDTLKEVIDIFDNPPFLHLGGDEVNMAKPCFDEVGSKMFDYNVFERTLKEILKEIQFDESKVIRWEMSEFLGNLNRAGKITHFWFRKPGDSNFNRYYPKDYTDTIFFSSDLYMDTNLEDTAFDMFVKTKRLKHNRYPHTKILGIVGGTFELSTNWWLDRNVVGRLLAISMGVSGINTTQPMDFYHKYREICGSIGFDDSMCNLYGNTPKRYQPFRNELKGRGGVWDEWISNTCERLTTAKEVHQYRRAAKNKNIVPGAQRRFWDLYYSKESFWQYLDMTNTTNKHTLLPFSGKRLVEHTGVIMDIAKYPLDSMDTLKNILSKTMLPMGLNTIQLRLITDYGFAYFSSAHPKLQYQSSYNQKRPGRNNYPRFGDLIELMKMAAAYGIVIMPEVAFSTNSGGMYNAGFNVACPNFLCEHGEYVPQDIGNGEYPPLLYSLIVELSQFTSSLYIHLGHDQREMSTPCFLEASNNQITPDFDHFENSMRLMLEFAGVSSSRVVRWENNERIHYPSRFGDITQCVAGERCRLASADNDNPKSPWFGTVDVRQGGAYEIYSTTHALASRSPLGVMAHIGSMREDHNDDRAHMIDYRLLAFSLGTLDLPLMDKDEFEKLYIPTCSATIKVPEENKVSKVEVAASRRLKNASLTRKNSTFSGDPKNSTPKSACEIFAQSSNEDIARLDALLNKNEEELLLGFRQETCNEQTFKAVKRFMKDPDKIETIVSIQA